RYSRRHVSFIQYKVYTSSDVFCAATSRPPHPNRSGFRSPSMAKLLYRLGMFSARRAKTIIFAWLAILAVAVGSFLTFGGQLSYQISMPAFESTEVADRMIEELD